MRFIVFIFLSGCATDKAFVPLNLFNGQPTSIGYGSSLQTARRNSESVIPKDFERESPSGAWGCAKPNEYPVWNETKQDSDCESRTYYYISPLLPKDPGERERLLRDREANRGVTYIGVGDTLTDAMADLLAKIPKHAVTDHTTFGCTKDISIDPETGHPFCDRAIPGNRNEIQVHTRKPNVPAYLKLE